MSCDSLERERERAKERERKKEKEKAKERKIVQSNLVYFCLVLCKPEVPNPNVDDEALFFPKEDEDE